MKNHCLYIETRWQPLRLLAAVLCVLMGCGRSVDSNSTTIERFRVSGSSMNPTLWDVSLVMSCSDCEIPIRVDAFHLEAIPSHRPLKCWHCGGQLDQTEPDVVRLPPDEIQLTQTGDEELRAGQLVLLRHDPKQSSHATSPSGLHVKRILATPTQTVSVDAEGRLRVDNQIPRFASVPKVLVDSGPHRTKSRWHCIGDRWWRYHHVLVHRANRPGPIFDDYPGNLKIDRRLYRVDQLAVVATDENETPPLDSPLIEEIQFWNAHPGDFLGLSDERPIAVRLRDGSEPETIANVQRLRVYREILYRVDRPPKHDATVIYPIKLANDEFFVVGDNVPVSVDSRSWGPVHRKNLVAEVVKTFVGLRD